MGDLPGVVQIVFGAIAVLTAAVSAILLTQQRVLRDSIKDRDQRIFGLEGRVTDLEASLTKEKADHESTRRDHEALARVVTGEAHLQAIDERVEAVYALLVVVRDVLTDMATGVRKILTKVGGR